MGTSAKPKATPKAPRAGAAFAGSGRGVGAAANQRSGPRGGPPPFASDSWPPAGSVVCRPAMIADCAPVLTGVGPTAASAGWRPGSLAGCWRAGLGPTARWDGTDAPASRTGRLASRGSCPRQAGRATRADASGASGPQPKKSPGSQTHCAAHPCPRRLAETPSLRRTRPLGSGAPSPSDLTCRPRADATALRPALTCARDQALPTRGSPATLYRPYASRSTRKGCSPAWIIRSCTLPIWYGTRWSRMWRVSVS